MNHNNSHTICLLFARFSYENFHFSISKKWSYQSAPVPLTRIDLMQRIIDDHERPRYSLWKNVLYKWKRNIKIHRHFNRMHQYWFSEWHVIKYLYIHVPYAILLTPRCTRIKSNTATNWLANCESSFLIEWSFHCLSSFIEFKNGQCFDRSYPTFHNKIP